MKKYSKVSLNIIYEDNQIIVVNKPAGLLTIASDKISKCLYHEVLMYVSRYNKYNRIFIVHRLDKDTSGLIIFSKTPDMKTLLQNEFEKQQVIRKYEAIVKPKVTIEEQTLTNYLFEDKFNNVFVSKNKTKTLAITSYKVTKKYRDYDILDIDITTGKRNQIRAQLSYIGSPILGDKKYYGEKSVRLYLNCYKLEFPNLKDKLAQTSFEIPKIFH